MCGHGLAGLDNEWLAAGVSGLAPAAGAVEGFLGSNRAFAASSAGAGCGGGEGGGRGGLKLETGKLKAETGKRIRLCASRLPPSFACGVASRRDEGRGGGLGRKLET